MLIGPQKQIPLISKDLGSESADADLVSLERPDRQARAGLEEGPVRKNDLTLI